jgi:tetratricopeptide (TPR) repeat protein
MPAYRQELARSHYMLGSLLAGQNQLEQAAVQFGKALAIQQRLAEEFPSVPAYRLELAFSHNKLGMLLASQNQSDKAAEQYGKALAIKQKLVDDFPAVPDYRLELAFSHNNLGLLLTSQNQADKAAEQYRMALDIHQKLAAEYPAVPEYQLELGGGCCNFGHRLRESGKPAESLPWFDRAVAALSRVHQQNPRSVMPRLFLRNSHGGRAMAYDLLHKHAEAVEDWTGAIELSSPQDQPSFQVRRAYSRVRAGQVSQAVAEVAELRKSTTMAAARWYSFACIYALASSKSADKKQEYADQAMRMLRHAVQVGYNDAAHIAKDKDLDVLRQRDDFKKLLESLAKPKEKVPGAKGH